MINLNNTSINDLKLEMKQIIITLLCSIFTFLLPIKGLVIIITLAVAIDTLLGIYTSKKLGIPIKSHLLYNIAVKIFFYWGALLLGYLLDVFIFDCIITIPFTQIKVEYGLSKLCTLVWVLVELVSWDESSQKLGNPPFLKLLKNLISKAKELKEDINDLTENDKDKE